MGKLLPFPIHSKAGIWTLAALLVLAILSAGLMQRQISDLRSELATATHGQRNEVLATLGAERSSGGGPTQVVRLSAEPQWMVFSLELDLLDHNHYRAILLDQDDREIWTSQDLLPTASDTLTLGIHSATLSPGVYTIQVHGLGVEGTSSFVSRFSFKAISAKD